ILQLAFYTGAAPNNYAEGSNTAIFGVNVGQPAAGGGLPLPPGVWTYASVTGTAPAGTASLGAYLLNIDADSNADFYFDDMSLTVIPAEPPVITNQPSGLVLTAGSNAVFKVAASGASPLAYQWQFNGTNLVNTMQVIGVQSNTLTISSVLPANAGNYQVVVTNIFGSVTSGVAGCVVIQTNFTEVSLNPQANANLQKYTDGTNYQLGGTQLFVDGVPFGLAELNNNPNTTGIVQSTGPGQSPTNSTGTANPSASGAFSY